MTSKHTDIVAHVVDESEVYNGSDCSGLLYQVTNIKPFSI